VLRRIADTLEIPPALLGLAETTPPVNRRQFLAGLNTTLATTVAHLDAAATAAGSEQQRRPVLVLLGHAHQSLGALAFDGLQFATAAEHFHTAHEVGVELGDADIIAAALTQLGDVARRQGRYGTALRLLTSTERHATAASVLTQVLRSKTLARAHAEIGDRRAFDWRGLRLVSSGQRGEGSWLSTTQLSSRARLLASRWLTRRTRVGRCRGRTVGA
jgi:hypothetical protein